MLNGDMSMGQYVGNTAITLISFAHPFTAAASVTYSVGNFVLSPGPHESVTDHY